MIWLPIGSLCRKPGRTFANAAGLECSHVRVHCTRYHFAIYRRNAPCRKLRQTPLTAKVKGVNIWEGLLILATYNEQEDCGDKYTGTVQEAIQEFSNTDQVLTAEFASMHIIQALVSTLLCCHSLHVRMFPELSTCVVYFGSVVRPIPPQRALMPMPLGVRKL